MEAIYEDAFLLRRIAIFLARRFVQGSILEYRKFQPSHANARISIFRQFRHAAAIA